MSKAREIKKEVKTEADSGESSGEEKDWDRDVWMEEDHTDESDKDQCLWERDHGQPDTDEDDVLSDLSENEIETKKMLVEICCSEKSRLTSEARKKGWKGVRVTQRNNIYRPRTMRKLKKLMNGDRLKKKGIERVHAHQFAVHAVQQLQQPELEATKHATRKTEDRASEDQHENTSDEIGPAVRESSKE